MKNQEGKNLETIQSLNRALVLKLLQQNHICSRATIAEQSGLKQATITNIVNDFISWGLVEETGFIEGGRGRRAIGIRLTENRFYYIGVRLQRRYFDVSLFTINGEPLDVVRENIPPSIAPQEVTSRIIVAIQNQISTNSDKKIIVIGMAVPGPYYSNDGILENITLFHNWKGFHIRKAIQDAFDIPVIVDHDANAGVLAECSLKFPPSKYETVVYIALGQGIGAGIYQNGKIFRGASGVAGEIGHVSVNIAGPKCECGNRGCLTNYVSTIALISNIAAVTEGNDGETNLTYEDVVALIKAKKEPAYTEFKKIMSYLSTALLNVIYMYNPELIIIGDEICQIGDMVIEEIKEDIKPAQSYRLVKQTEVKMTTFSRDPALIGASIIAVDFSFNHTELFR